MTGASQFFTTLAQVTAVAIGFVIAFAAALYTIRRNRIHGQSQEVITQIESFVKKYRPQLESLNRELDNPDIDDPRFIEGKFYSGEYSDDIELWAEKQSNELEAYTRGNIYWALRLFDDVSESSGSDVFQYFDLLSYSVNNLQDTRPAFPPDQKFVSSSQEMKKDYDRIATKMYNLRSNKRKSKIGPVILKSKILFFIGVIFPVSLLLSVPEPITIYELTGFSLYIVQIINLIIIIVISWSIFSDLQNLMVEELF